MTTMERIKALRDRNKVRSSGGGRKLKGIFFNWQDGANPIRLVGNFLEVHTHFVAPSAKRRDKGLCIDSAFVGKDSLQKVLNCLDWDIDKEAGTEHQTCPICALGRAAKLLLNDAKDETQKKALKAIMSATWPRLQLKWNIIDRANPNVTETDDQGKETPVLGLKIASIGGEAWDDIEAIFKNTGKDIATAEDGCDVVVTKSEGSGRTEYSAAPVMDGFAIKPTPLTKEERALRQHDLKRMCGAKADAAKVLVALREEYADMLMAYADKVGFVVPDAAAAEEPATETAEAAEPEAEPEAEAPAPAPAPAPTKAPAKAPAKAVAPPPPALDNLDEDPEAWECFGQHEPGHPECSKCQAAEKCQAKQASLQPKRGKKANTVAAK